jgi:hypothetical protein
MVDQPVPPPAPQQPAASRGDIWRHRLLAALVVIFFIEIGMFLVVVPWTFVWTDNKLLLMHPEWRNLITHGFTRGVITGLGLINVWIGIWEAVHFNDKV